MEEILLYLATGALVGVLAGLLGVGGGLVIVPILTMIFAGLHFAPQHIQHLALGTSLASIVVTSVSSARAHHRRSAVNWQIFRDILPGIALGCLSGAWLASRLDAEPLKIVFVLFEFYVGTQLLLEFSPNASRSLPGRVGMALVGVVIGALSSLVGIGGGSLSVPFMVWCNCNMREAVGTSSAIGFPIAVFGSIGFIIAGWGVNTLPAHSAGFVYLPAMVGLALASVLTAPFGAKLAHRLPVPLLKKIFAFLLYGLGLKMALTI
jgi:uncharacterized membrane protein YfcA